MKNKGGFSYDTEEEPDDKKNHYKKRLKTKIFCCAVHSLRCKKVFNIIFLVPLVPPVLFRHTVIMPSLSNDLHEDKKALRVVMRARRKMAAAQTPEASLALRDHILRTLMPLAADVVATTVAVGNEIDPGPLNEALLHTGYRLCLPAVVQPGQALVFRHWSQNKPLTPGRYGVLEPPGDEAIVDPSVLFIPLLAFDRKGHRLGQGGGYYDRTLANLRAQGPLLAIGLGFAMQEVAAVPTGPHDERLDVIVTEREVFQPVGEQDARDLSRRIAPPVNT